MATDTSNTINYYLCLKKEQIEHLGSIRLWSNLKAAFEGTKIWVTGFEQYQIESLEVKTIPYKTIFDEHDGKLHLHNSLLPERNIPSLLWTKIDRALPIELPSLNHNFFGIEEQISMQLIASETEAPAIAMVTSVDRLKAYIETAPSIRLQNLKWAVLENNEVFILGQPLLPITGNVFWQRADFIIPVGFDFELSLLVNTLNNVLNTGRKSLIIWNKDSSYFKIGHTDLQRLSLSSFRQTFT